MDNYWELKKPLPNEENQKVINEFLLSLKNANRKENTVSYFRKGLQSFFKEWKDPFSSLTSDEIQQWVAEQQNHIKVETIVKHLSVLRFFYSFCVEEGHLDQSPIPYRGSVGRDSDRYWELWGTLPNEENQKVINEYLLYMKNLNMSKNTIISYRKQLQFIFKEMETPFSSLTSDAIQHWIIKHQDSRKEETMYKYWWVLYSFYDFCVDEGHIEKSPVPILWKGLEPIERYWEVQISLPNKENQEVINEYLLSLKVANYSEATIKNYRVSLQKFFSDRKDLFSNFTSEMILEYLEQFNKDKKETTIKNHLDGLKSFYNFCVEEGYLEQSPIKSRWFPRLPKPVPKYLGKEELAKIRQESEMDCHRNRVILEFLLSTGCRIKEVHSLNRAEVNLENRNAIVMGKGKKIRQVHFTEKCALLLERYLDSRKDTNPALFVTSRRKPKRLSIMQMQLVLKGIGERTDLTGSLFPHRCRHTFATELLEKGAELSFIADALGHSDLKTTQIYATVPNRKIISMYRKYMG